MEGHQDIADNKNVLFDRESGHWKEKPFQLELPTGVVKVFGCGHVNDVFGHDGNASLGPSTADLRVKFQHEKSILSQPL